MQLEAGKYIHIHTQYGQGLDLTGSVCYIINTTGKCPEGVNENQIRCLASNAKDTFMVRIDHIVNGQCEVEVGDYCRLRNWYEQTWEEAMLPPDKVYEGLLE